METKTLAETCEVFADGDWIESKDQSPDGIRLIQTGNCTIIRFNRKEVIPEFFNYYSQSDDYLNTVDSETTGTTRKRISRSKLGLTSILVPPLAEQRKTGAATFKVAIIRTSPWNGC